MLKRKDSNTSTPGPHHWEPPVTLFKSPHDQRAHRASYRKITGGGLRCGPRLGAARSGRFCRHRPEHSRFECDCGPLPPATMMDQPLTPGLGGARGHAHTAPHNTCTIQTQHRRGYPPRGPAWKSGVQNPSVSVSRGHLPGSTVGVCEPRLRRELALGPRWASIPQGTSLFQDATRPRTT